MGFLLVAGWSCAAVRRHDHRARPKLLIPTRSRYSAPRASVDVRQPFVALPKSSFDVDVGRLLSSLATKQARKYSLESVKQSLEAILHLGISTSQASEMYGVNRSTLQFYLKKLNIVRRNFTKKERFI